ARLPGRSCRRGLEERPRPLQGDRHVQDAAGQPDRAPLHLQVELTARWPGGAEPYFAKASFIRRAAMPNELSGPYRARAPMTTAISWRPFLSAEAGSQKPAGSETPVLMPVAFGM